MKKVFLIFVASLIFASHCWADMTGASDSVMIVQLTKMNALLASKYSVMLKKLQEAKAHSKFLSDVVEKARMLKGEYDFVKNFSIQNVLHRAQNDFEDLTYLDNLDGRSGPDQFSLILADIDRRFDRPNPKDQSTRRKLKGRVNELQRLQALLRAKLDEADKLTEKGANIKSMQRATATTNCMLLALEVQRQQRKMMEDAQDINDEIEMNSKLTDFQKALKKMGSGSASKE